MTIESRITEELIRAAIANDDLNDALFTFQQTIGVDDGGVAAVVFSGGWDDEWPSANAARRLEMMNRYVGLECFYASSAGDDESDESHLGPTA